MELEISRHDHEADESVATLAVTGSIDMSSRKVLVDAGLAALAEARSLTLDLSEVDFMDSTGIGALIELARTAERKGRSFVLAATSPRVRRVLEVTGLADAWSPA